jgi:thiol-disulfide isomerase/thioredoxin
MKTTKWLFFQIFFFPSYLPLQAQNDSYAGLWEIGKEAPDVVLREINFDSNDSLSLKDLKGKHVILDFFSSGCAVCFKAMPKINHLQRAFGDRVKFILVGIHDNLIRSTYRRMAAKFGLDLTIAFDSTIHKTRPARTVPFYVFIDDKGVVKGFNSSGKIDSALVSDFLLGKWGEESSKSQGAARYIFDFSKPLLLDDNGGDEEVFYMRSILAPYTFEAERATQADPKTHIPFQFLGYTLKDLYNAAFFGTTYRAIDHPNYGKVDPFPVWKIKDSTVITMDTAGHLPLYSYSLIMAGNRDSAVMLQKMQFDLNTFFDFNATIETGVSDCFKLTASKKARKLLATKGGEPSGDFGWGELRIVNQPVASLISTLDMAFHQVPAFFDRTGIHGNIDLTLEGVFTDLEDIKNALQKKGLKLTPYKKSMKKLVITDRSK